MATAFGISVRGDRARHDLPLLDGLRDAFAPGAEEVEPYTEFGVRPGLEVDPEEEIVILVHDRPGFGLDRPRPVDEVRRDVDADLLAVIAAF